jgi:radical SAM protein with 4Fe4S-binding SPASM domain
VPATSWKGFEFRWPGGAERTRELTSLTGSLRALRRRRVADWITGRPWTSFVPAIAPEDVPAYFTEPGRVFGHDLCPVAWYFAQVEPDGEVCFCGDFPDYFIGNVRDTAFREVWGSPKANAFREKLAREPLPICARCCGSFVYGKWPRPGPPPDLAGGVAAARGPSPTPNA